MSFFTSRINGTEMTNDTTQESVMSEVNLYRDSHLPRSDLYTSEDVYAAVVQKLSDLFKEVTACEAELDHYSKKGKKRARHSSHQESTFNSKEIEYRAILESKGNFIEKITAVTENLNSSPNVPIAKVHCYQKYVALLKKRFENSQHEANQLIEDIRNTRQELERVKQELKTFQSLVNEEKSTNEGEEITELFKQAKEDLNSLLTHLYPDNLREQFSHTMARLTDAFITNNEEEDQYVELSPEILQNSGILCLIQSFVIIEDPLNPLRYRLNMGG